MPNFWKTRPDPRTGAEKEDVSGETQTYGNPMFNILNSTEYSTTRKVNYSISDNLHKFLDLSTKHCHYMRQIFYAIT